MIKNQLKRILTALLSFSFYSFATTEYSEYADLNRELMLLPVSASLGGADLSLSAGAAYGSSPANLPFDTSNNLTLSYANFYQNTFSSSILSYSGPAGTKNGIGITAGYVYIPDVEDNRNSPETENHTLIPTNKIRNCSDIYVRFSFGHRFDVTPAWVVSAGLALNGRRSRLLEYSGYGIGVDAGTKVYHKVSGISLVMQIENITSNYTYWSENYREYSYTHIRLGLGWEKAIPYIYGKVRIGYTSPDLLSNEGINKYSKETDTNNQKIEIPSQEKVHKNPELLFSNGRLGLEYSIMSRVALRAGLSQGKFNFGAGLQFFSNKAGIDFAYTAHQLSGTYQMSMMYRW